jgi:acyl-CoA synthetase (AMP-forming)/AMP-acid ligase II
MYLKSPFPDPPALPEVNAHHIFFNRSDQPEWPDYVIHVDVETEERIMYREFTARIQHLATGLGAPLHQGGMDLRAQDGEIVGIIAENSSVSIYL